MTKMTQTVLSYKLEMEKDTSLTSFSGLPLVTELMTRLKIPRLIKKKLKLKKSGWSDVEMVTSLINLAIAGGEHLSDMRILQKDAAFQRLIQSKGMPGAKAAERYLKRFHDDSLMHKPADAKSWVPQESLGLKALGVISQELARREVKISNLKTVTIENDATQVESSKDEAKWTYQGVKGYMPVVGIIAELGIIIADEFRDGNVAPNSKALEFFKRCEKAVPEGIKVRTRLDAAYYSHDLMKHLENQKIEYTITADKTVGLMRWIEAIPEQDWQPLMKITQNGAVPSGREWAQISWCSANGSQADIRENCRKYLITRRTQEQVDMFAEKMKEIGGEVDPKDRYEAIVTNMDWSGDRLIRWHYEKAGSIEKAHDKIKNGLGGGVMPCAEFGANAAWWRIQCMALNIVRALQIHALPSEFANSHMKRLRLHLFGIAGRVIKHARQLILKIGANHPSYEMYKEARIKIANIAWT